MVSFIMVAFPAMGALQCRDVSHAGGLRLWTHFDVMSNLLCQIHGKKHIRLWPPSQVQSCLSGRHVMHYMSRSFYRIPASFH